MTEVVLSDPGRGYIFLPLLYLLHAAEWSFRQHFRLQDSEQFTPPAIMLRGYYRQQALDRSRQCNYCSRFRRNVVFDVGRKSDSKNFSESSPCTMEFTVVPRVCNMQQQSERGVLVQLQLVVQQHSDTG